MRLRRRNRDNCARAPWNDPPVSWIVIGVPIDSVGRAGGTELAPAALRERGLVARVGAERPRRPRRADPRRRRATARRGVIGIDDVLRDDGGGAARRCATWSAGGDRPLLLGGCCTLVPGALAGLRDAVGAHGVAYVDGHVDVYDGRTRRPARRPTCRWAWRSASGPSAGSRPPAARRTAPADVVVLGARDPEEADDIAGLLGRRLAAIRCSARTSCARGLRGRDRAAAGSAVLDPPRRRRARRARDARDRLPDARRAGLGRAHGADGAARAPRRRSPGSASAA